MYPSLTEAGAHNPPDLRVSDGDRTRDNRDHNPVLYRLSYTHHCSSHPEPGSNYRLGGRARNPVQLPASSSAATAFTSSDEGPGWGTKAVRR